MPYETVQKRLVTKSKLVWRKTKHLEYITYIPSLSSNVGGKIDIFFFNYPDLTCNQPNSWISELLLDLKHYKDKTKTNLKPKLNRG